MKILDVGSGVTPKLISDYTEIDIYYCDKQLSPPQDMENLNYTNNFFDLVICVNALDHTINAEQALREMLRVSRRNVYINCAIDQRTRHRKKHYWDAKPDGRFVNSDGEFDLKDYGFKIEFEDGRMIAKCSL